MEEQKEEIIQEDIKKVVNKPKKAIEVITSPFFLFFFK